MICSFFGFMKGKGTTDAIFIVRQMQEKFRAKALFWLCEFGKAFDRIPREVIRWAIHKLGVEEWLVLAVMSMYTGAQTVVTTGYGNSNCFEVNIGMHQSSALSPLLFVTVVEALSREFRVVLRWELLYADDLVVIAETEDDLIKRLNEWKDNMENGGDGKGWGIKQSGWVASIQIVGACAPKNPEDGKQRYDCWVSPVGVPTCLCKWDVGKPSQKAAQLCAMAWLCK